MKTEIKVILLAILGVFLLTFIGLMTAYFINNNTINLKSEFFGLLKYISYLLVIAGISFTIKVFFEKILS